MSQDHNLNPAIVYRATKLERFLSRTDPYWWFLPLNKRERVRLRSRFKYTYRKRFMNDMVSALKDVYAENEDKLKQVPSWELEDYEWTVETN